VKSKFNGLQENIDFTVYCCSLYYQDGPGSVPQQAGDSQDVELDKEKEVLMFTRKARWQISSGVTTQHLLSVISSANTLMSMNHATFKTPRPRSRRRR